MKTAFQLNNISHAAAQIFKGSFGRAQSASKSTGRQTHEYTRNFSLAQVLRSVEHVDLVDMDAQGAEGQLVSSAADVSALETKVYRICIETHTHALTAKLTTQLRAHRFLVVDSIPFSSRVRTEHGTVLFRGGHLFAVNERFVRPCILQR